MKRRLALSTLATLPGLPAALQAAGRSPAAAAAPSPTRSAAHAAVTLAGIEARTGGRLGVQVTGPDGFVLMRHREDERFPMCSTFKALAVAAVLRRIERGEESIDRRIGFTKADLLEWAPVAEKSLGKGLTVAELCAAAIELSDNTAANLLLGSLGGPQAVTRFAREIGDPVTRLDRREPELNDWAAGDERDTTTPRASARTLRALLLGDALSPASRQRLGGWMRNCRTGEGTLRAGLPSYTILADKTGTGPRGTRNDIGVAWIGSIPARVIAVYLNGARVDRAAQDAAIADVARLVTALPA